MSATVQSDTVVSLDAVEAFNAVTQALADALARDGIVLDPEHGVIADRDGAVLGSIVAWEPGERAALRWRQERWSGGEVEVELETSEHSDGARIAVSVRGLDEVLGDDPEAPAAWFGSELLAPLVQATGSRSLGDWVTDRRVRRPSGDAARSNYRDPKFHWPNFDAILDQLQLAPSDRLLEVGCGGGAFLSQALRSGCSAAAADHSADMVRLARELNAEAIAAGRLEIVQAEAGALEFEPGSFTCAAMTGVLAFIPDQVGALAEVHRLLAPGGRLVVYTGSPAMRGTPAAPEPYASRLRFLENDELEAVATEAGFAEVLVEQPDLRPFAKERGFSGRMLGIFAPKMGQLLVARKAA
jgi:SAM-dependent methyltransferase